MDNQLKSLLNEDESSFISENFRELADRIEKLPLTKKIDSERMEKVDAAIAYNTSK